MRRLPGEISALSVILGVATLSALGVALAGARPAPVSKSSATVKVTATVIPRVVVGPLSGEQTPRRLALRQPLAAILDNAVPGGRPQAGLEAASLVFETVVENGITRLLAIFLEHDAKRVGPIRSARPYFVKWAAGFGAAFIHAGGSPASLTALHRFPTLTDVEALGGRTAFARSKQRKPPHDLFARLSSVRLLASSVSSANGTPVLQPLAHALDTPVGGRRRSVIQISFSTTEVASAPSYDVVFRYDRQRHDYLRSVGGTPTVDGASHNNIVAANVIVLYTTIRLIPGDTMQRVSIGGTAHGNAEFFRNGRAYAGRWSRGTATNRFAFFTQSGSEFGLAPGQTWIEVVPPGAVSSR